MRRQALQSFEWLIGWRYARVGRRGRGNGFISFISGVSMLGIALGVAALIIVLSVMNGFQKDVRDRMLSVVSHIEIYALQGDLLDDALALQTLKTTPGVQASAPFVAAQALIARGDVMRGVLVRGIDPDQETKVADALANQSDLAANLEQLQAGSYHTVLGADLARGLGVGVGDSVTLIVPSGQPTLAGIAPRLRQFTVVGLFNSGHFEYDSQLALTSLQDAQRLTRSAVGLRLKLNDLHQAPQVAAQLQNSLGNNFVVRDWTQQNRTWFAAVQLEKRMMFIILTLIIAVAAFNLVSTLVMSVTDKAADIAILRTLGASPRSIMGIFMVQGAWVGIIGTLLGLLLGLLIACNIDVLVPALERLLHTSFLPKEVYLINRMPSDPQTGDIVPIALMSLLLAFIATIYPSWRASRVQPAQALR
jgi:lipoprotein-releasing system permease protein